MAPIGEKKKHHVVLWVVLILVFVLILLPIGLAFAFFFDPSHTSSEDLGVDTSGTHKSNFQEELVVDLFDYTDDNSKNNSLMITIDEQEINQALYDNLLSTMDSNTKSFVPQVYLDIGEDKYTFTAELNAYGFFKTKLYLITELSLSTDPQGLMFTLKDVKIGRMGGLTGISLNFLKNYINDQKLNEMFSKSFPFKLESHIFDSDTHYIFYSHHNFVSDMNNMVNLSGDAAFFKDFLINMIEEKKFTFDFYSDKAIKGALPLQEFHDNSSFGSYNDYVIDFASKAEINKYLPSLLKSGDVTDTNIEAVTKFLSYGYSQLSEIEKVTINSSSYLTTALGKTLEEYSATREAKFATKGKALDEVEKVEDIVSHQISQALTLTRMAEIIANNGGQVTDVQVTEVDLHDVLKTNSVIGHGKVFYRQQADGNYKVSFISIDNMYINIVNNNLYFVIGMNVNGYEISVVLSTILQSGGKGKIYFKLDSSNAYLGNYKLPESLFTSFKSLLSSSIGGNDWFSYDNVNNRFVVDFSSAINSNLGIQTLKANGLTIDIGISAIGNDISSNGYINIDISASKD